MQISSILIMMIDREVCVNQQSNIGLTISLSAIGSFKLTTSVQLGLLWAVSIKLVHFSQRTRKNFNSF